MTFKNGVQCVVAMAAWGLLGAGVLCERASADIITFANTTPITIPAEGIADPYPLSIDVSGVTGQIVNIQVSLFGLSHTWPNDLAAVVVSPTGSSAMLFNGPGGNIRASNLNFVFDDNAAARLPDEGELFSGTYRPGQEQYDNIFPDPGPGGIIVDGTPPPWAFEFAPWFTQNPNGRWDLFVLDAQAGDRGSISGGWAITFDVIAVPEPSALAVSCLAVGVCALRRRRQIA